MPAAATVEGKQLVQDYLKALSGQAKTAELVGRFVEDAGLKQHIQIAEAAFPAYEFIAHHVVAEGDLVAVRATFHGVHKGEFAGIPPVGRRASSDLMIIYRVRDGASSSTGCRWI
jgi:predicted ester cyclase